MKGIVLSFLVFIIDTIAVVWILRRRVPEEKFKVLLKIYLFFSLFFFPLYFMTPEDLGFLPDSFLEKNPKADFVNGFVLYHLFFWLFTVQTYSLASRGFSTEMLMTIEKSGLRRLDSEEIKRSFAGGKGVAWNFEDKLRDCLRTGLVRFENGRYYHTKRGGILASAGIRLKNFLKVGPGG